MDERDRELEWEASARRVIQVEMRKRDMSYARLVEALAKIGEVENERALRNKIARGTFSATFFLKCLVAMGLKSLDLDLLWPHQPVGDLVIHASAEGFKFERGGHAFEVRRNPLAGLKGEGAYVGLCDGVLSVSADDAGICAMGLVRKHLEGLERS